MTDLAQRLKDHGIKAKDLAQKAGVSPSYLSMLLKGHRNNPSLKAVERIVAASGGALSVADFTTPTASEAA